jgi:MFS family permease
VPGLRGGALGRARAGARRFPRGFWTLIAGDVLQSFAFGLVTPYLTLYLTRTIGVSASLAGVLLATFTVGALAGTPLGGVMSDRLGRRPVMIAGLAGTGVAAVAFALVDGPWPIAVLIVAWGVSSSLFDPAAAGYIADVVAPELRTEAYGIKRLVNNASFALGVPAGALLTYLFSLRAAFLAAGVAVLVFLLVVWRALPESRTRHEIERDEPARFREALRDGAVMRLAAGALLAYALFSVYEGSIPVFLNEERGLGIATWGALFTINPVLVTLLQYPVSRFAARRYPRAMLAAGALLYGAALAIFIPSGAVPVVALAVVVFSVGEMLSEPVMSTVAADLAPARLRGTYQSVVNLSLEVAWAPASIVGLWLIGRGQGEVLLAAALPVGAAAAIVFLTLPRVRRAEPVPEGGDPARRTDPLRPPH